ncbi:unnamed protein product [Gongylonema pulchrum]|uniref:Pkinase_Tyr domain-containing protein n=1 Tax=Gongylonema pulchrum TaxID=637853 RepID=A0A183DGG1_9BILA|nr:unnamed protein product [Gongylonema pulchrum]
MLKILPVDELEGKFGEMKWAIWRQNLEGVAGDVDDEEDNACFEEQVLTKTLKNTADRRNLRKFLEESLALASVTQHDNIAHVCACCYYTLTYAFTESQDRLGRETFLGGGRNPKEFLVRVIIRTT